ncbi:neurogenic locus notch homolog protein 4-like [Nematolebias whitei]|uniref:neurogenic locus notch homolog protein 4-like n=1 Tax=Nematolebias whitei TaxID=451745 RepID=UPI0018972F03|nr:neurogenic locus notch homolog protein 4-like [Nematolebias whitei]
MEISLPPEQPSGINSSLSTCRDAQCGSHGTCVASPGGGTKFVCDCDLGYKGEFCEGTFNGALSVPLTVSVLVIVVGLVILAIVIAKLQQKRKKKLRRNLDAKHGYNIVL